MLYIYINLFGWRCANLAVATQSWRGHRTWPISQRERKTYLHKFRTKHLSMATAMGKHGKTYGTIWESHYEYLWMLISMANMNQSMWNYVNICEHHENHRWTSQNPQTLVSILIPLSPSLSLCFDGFFFWRFGPWHVQRLSDSSGSSIPKFHFSQRQVAKEGTCLVSGKHM